MLNCTYIPGMQFFFPLTELHDIFFKTRHLNVLAVNHSNNLTFRRWNLHWPTYFLILMQLSPEGVSLASHHHYWPLSLHLRSDCPYTPLKALRHVAGTLPWVLAMALCLPEINPWQNSLLQAEGSYFFLVNIQLYVCLVKDSVSV